MPRIRTWLILCRRLLKRAGPAPARRGRLTPRLEQLEVREVLSGYAPTGVEQEFLERLNDARANPAAYGRSIGLDLSGVAPSQPLAFNTSLVQSSRGHSADMNAHNYFGHTGSDGSNPFQRMAAAGFPSLGAEESIAAGYPTPEIALAGLIIDSGVPDLGHRKQMLSIGGSPYQQEQQTGVGIVLGGSGAYHNYYTIDSGNTADARPFLTGVAYDDLSRDGLYENGEGLGGVTITAAGTGGTYRTATWGSGGYSLQVAAGTYTVTAAGGALAAPISRVVTVGPANFRLDFKPPTGITTTALTASPNPSRAGQAVTLTATVTSGASGTPTGTVEFFDGATDLGPGSPLRGSGTRATSVLVTAALSAGNHALKAVFSPTGVFRGSQGTLTQAVRADHLAFAVQPGDAVAGVPLAPAVQVVLLDPLGNLQTGDNSDRVTLAVAGGPGTFAAGSTTTVTAKGGVATFDHLVLTTAGSYTLKVSATGGVTGPDSVAFVVSPTAADHLAFAVPPSLVVVGQAISPAVRVRVLDRFGNVLTADDSDQVTLSVAAGPGGFAGGSTTTATVSGGTATFDNLVLTASGSYTLGETGTGGLTGPNSAVFTAALFTDSFNRPDGPGLGPDWTVVMGAPGVRGNRLVMDGGVTGLAVTGSVARANVGVQATIALPATGAQFAGLVARYTGPGVSSFYRGQVVSNNGQYTAYLFRRLGGTFTQLGPAVPVATGTGTLRLEAVGNSLKLFLNGRLLIYTFDSALATGSGGVCGSPGAVLDNFEGDAINPAAVALPFRDGFAQPAGGQLSRSWTERAGNFQAQGNGQLRAAAPGVSLATVNLATAAADVALQANVALPATGSLFAGLAARYSGTGDGNMYLGVVAGGNGNFAASIYRHVGTAWTLLSYRALTGGTGVLRFVVKGSRLQLLWNGVVVCDVSDTAIVTGGLVGLRASQGALYSNLSASAS